MTSNFKRQDIEFLSDSTICRAWHYRPALTDEASAPCIVMAHGLGGTRDAGLEPYAERFVEAGFHVVLFDYRHFGASDGQPRQLLRVSRQQADWRAAVACARKLDGVDPERIALWGTSFSGGHVASIAAQDSRIAAFSAQGPMMDGRAAVFGLLGYAGVGVLLKMTAYGLADQIKAMFGLSPVTMPLTAPPGGFAAMSSHDAHSGYGALQPPGFRNEMTARMALTLALYRPIAKVDRIQCPALIQACMKDTVAPAPAATKMAQKLHKRLGDKVTLKEYDMGHFDIYVGNDYELAVEDQLAFFKRHLQ